MPGKLRRKGSRGAGLAAETPDQNSLPMLEAVAAAAALPRAFGLEQELIAAGYFDQGVVAQWRLVQDRLAERAAEAIDPLAPLLVMATAAEARIRFHVPGCIARIFEPSPDEAVRTLRPLASDEADMVSEAVQAFGLRPQAEQLGPAVIPLLREWLEDRNERVRRNAIEALRPRGVWVRHLSWSVESPAYLVPMLDALRGDPSRYVANAVANCLNDISKSRPELVLEVIGRWQLEGAAGPHHEHLVRKALRTMVKDGDCRALTLLGYGDLDLSVHARLRNGDVVAPNTALVFELEIENHGPTGRAELVYQIETPGKNPERPRTARFRAGEVEIPGHCFSEFLIRERIYDRKSARLLDGLGRAVFLFNGIEYAVVHFGIRRNADE